MTTPLIFISHGAPDVALHNGATLACWEKLGHDLPRPQAILLLSAHWETPTPTFSTAVMPATIHDFGGFPPTLYQMQYPAPGAPALAGQVAECLGSAGIPLKLDPQRGLDHGAWIPLQSIYPLADVPVAQLSIQPDAGTAWHLQLGQALRPLREEGVMIITSGAVTHNFGWLSAQNVPFPPAKTFSDWLGDKLARREVAELLDYRTRAPYGKESHPTEEHLLPLFVALGATVDEDQMTRFTPEFTYGGLAMDVYVWE